MSKKDVVGQRFGRLIVKKFHGEKGRDRFKVVCQCDCGNEKQVYVYSLLNGDTRSCGCLNLEEVKKRSTTHGMSRTPLHHTWLSMKQRCYNPNNPHYRYYGAKGITVCKRWRDSFEAFFSDMGPRPPGTSLDRVNGKKGYSLSNCRWADWRTQAQNRPSYCVQLTFQGKTQTAAEWAREIGITDKCLYHRLERGWSVARALTSPAYNT